MADTCRTSPASRPGPGRILPSVALLATCALLGAALSCSLALRAKHACNRDSDCLGGSCVAGTCDPCTRIDDADGCLQLGSCAWVNTGDRKRCLTVPLIEEQTDCNALSEAECRRQYPVCLFNVEGGLCEQRQGEEALCSQAVFQYECEIEGCAWTGESCYYIGDELPDLCSSEAFSKEDCLSLGAGCYWEPQGNYCVYQPTDVDQCALQGDQPGCDQVGGCRWVGDPVDVTPDGGSGADGAPAADAPGADAADGGLVADGISDSGAADATPDAPPPPDGGPPPPDGGQGDQGDLGPDAPPPTGYCTSAEAAPQGSCDLYLTSTPCIASGCAWANLGGEPRCVYLTQQERCANQSTYAGCIEVADCAWDGQACFYYKATASMSEVVP